MRVFLGALLALLALPAWAQPAATADVLAVPAEPIIDGAIEGYLRPSFDGFAVTATAFKATVERFCTNASPEALGAAQDQFKNTALAYGRVEFMRFGPLAVGDRADRILLWPDPKGITLRQVQAALASADNSVLDPDMLKPKSVAMQGLVAAEYLLFGTGEETLASASPEGSFRCGYLKSIATLIEGLAATLDREWQDISASGPAAEMLHPTPDGKSYRSTDEVVERITQQLRVGNETIRDQRLLPILGEAEGVPKPKSALFWRSGLTMPLVSANFAGLRALFDAAALAQALGKAGSASTANSIVFEFDTAAKAAGLVKGPIDVALSDPDQLRHLKELVFVTRSLDTLLGQTLPGTLGLVTGFSLLDGD
jgi:predicted lipoprotein